VVRAIEVKLDHFLECLVYASAFIQRRDHLRMPTLISRYQPIRQILCITYLPPPRCIGKTSPCGLREPSQDHRASSQTPTVPRYRSGQEPVRIISRSRLGGAFSDVLSLRSPTFTLSRRGGIAVLVLLIFARETWCLLTQAQSVLSLCWRSSLSR